MLSRRGPISPLPAGTPRRRRLPRGGTCEHRAKEETLLSPGMRAATAAGPPRPRQRPRSAPRARPPPRPAGHVVPPLAAAPEAPSGSLPSPAAGHSCLAPLSAAPTRSPATSCSQRPSLLSLARPSAGRLRLIRSFASPEGSPASFAPGPGLAGGVIWMGRMRKAAISDGQDGERGKVTLPTRCPSVTSRF